LQQSAADYGSADLQVSATTPTARIEPRDPGRGPVALPELEYTFRIDAVCRGNLAPASLSLAVADTRLILDSKQIESGNLQAIRLRIPAKQIAPVVVTDFCVVDQTVAEPAAPIAFQSPLVIRAALSAQVSMLCPEEAGQSQSMKYASALLDVTLVCDGNDTAAQELTNR
jgi:hypothetical protein